MKYALRNNHRIPHDATTCLGWLLDARGVEDTEKYVFPTKENELEAKDLDNIDDAAQMLIWHLNSGNRILVIVD